MATESSSDISEERRVEIERKVRQRVTLEKKAFELVTHLSLTHSVTEKELIDIGQQITQDDYSDVTEERSIEKLCGYPLCSNKLEKILKQKYKISVKNSTVYDITERKKFCSNQCYEASKYFQNQISETPVWTRETEKPVILTILQRDETQKVFPKGRNGELVFEFPRSNLSEELAALKLAETDDIQDKSAPANNASDEQPKRATEKSDLSTKSMKTEIPPEKQQQNTGLLESKKTATQNSLQQRLSLSEKLKVIKEWKTPKTIDFFHQTARRELSDYESRVFQMYGTNPERNDKTDVLLAPVDNYSQQIQRRKIVWQRLATVWSKLEMLLGMDTKDCMSDVKSLVGTFEFSNKNILFQPIEWIIVGYILLRILDEKIKCLSNDNKTIRLDLTPYSVTEEEISEIVDYMTIFSDMDTVD